MSSFSIIPHYVNEPVLDNVIVVRWMVIGLILLMAWYILKYLNGPKFSLKFWQVTLLGILFFLAIRFIPYALGIPIRAYSLPGNLFTVILIQTIQYILQSQENISKLRLEKEQLISENYKSQLKVLRSQRDPHVLFNSLSTLRSMVRSQHENAEQFVMSLSDFYRQTFKNHDRITISLSEELSVVESYPFFNEEQKSTCHY
jgi:sensor histidine kinase YesM